mmetsp:Transcript_14966/g.30250  ORF Transcript_14966/g.30250 Transcript_14966/m.30250 type:complete len:98 (+) Transcript_14966:105-398(+)
MMGLFSLGRMVGTDCPFLSLFPSSRFPLSMRKKEVRLTKRVWKNGKKRRSSEANESMEGKRKDGSTQHNKQRAHAHAQPSPPGPAQAGYMEGMKHSN